MPLGNYTSQFFANVYLNELDQYVKHKLRAKYYIRYVDDFVILHNSKEQLIKWKEEINNFLKEKLKIELHQQKSGVLNLSGGITFLGFRIFTHHMLIRGSNLEKFNRRLEILEMLYNEEEITRNEVVEHLEGWLAFIKYANMHKYTMRLLKSFNKSFPIRKEMGQILDSSKKTANFLKKIDFSKLEFSVQQTLHLFSEKKMKPKQIADIRKLKESTIWKHLANLIEYGQWSLWKVIKKKKIIQILPKIISGNDKLKDIKERLSNPFITYDEINCVLAHIKFKEKIKQ